MVVDPIIRNRLLLRCQPRRRLSVDRLQDVPNVNPSPVARRIRGNPVRTQASLRLDPNHTVRGKLATQFLRQVEACKNTNSQRRKSKGDSENSRLKCVSHDAVNELQIPYFRGLTHLNVEAVTEQPIINHQASQSPNGNTLFP